MASADCSVTTHVILLANTSQAMENGLVKILDPSLKSIMVIVKQDRTRVEKGVWWGSSNLVEEVQTASKTPSEKSSLTP